MVFEMDELALQPAEREFLAALNRLGVRYLVAESKVVAVDGLHLPVLPLERILVSKRAADRPKDRAAIPALEVALAVAKDERDSS